MTGKRKMGRLEPPHLSRHALWRERTTRHLRGASHEWARVSTLALAFRNGRRGHYRPGEHVRRKKSFIFNELEIAVGNWPQRSSPEGARRCFQQNPSLGSGQAMRFPSRPSREAFAPGRHGLVRIGSCRGRAREASTARATWRVLRAVEGA
jgi:hypothetical protein